VKTSLRRASGKARLEISGDTETKLQLKNALDAVESPRWLAVV
jgi:predicted lipid carrier protein YhbT